MRRGIWLFWAAYWEKGMKSVANELGPRYNPRDVEDKWYGTWRERGYFRPSMAPGAKPFSIVMPPPNVTGVLHLGHALNATWQDILVRFHRMRGDNTLWLPGTDHAGIHTQIKVDESLRAAGLSRQELGRERFIEEVWRWKDKYGGEILAQFAKIGVSVDWDRLKFTLDPDLVDTVTEVFVRLYEEGLIYRGDYITNWCVSCRTALSDVEVEHEELAGTLTYIRYPLADGPESITVATTRPETLLGDTAVAVHPDDPRWAPFIGRTVRLPLVDRIIPIVADSAVDPDYGTGAVKVTPAHDPNDFDMGERHGLDRIKVIDEEGRMTAEAGAFQGMDRKAARRAVGDALASLGLIERVEDLVHSVGHCEKCHEVIEPLISRQWFVRVKPLAEAAVEAVDSGAVRFLPERFEKVYTNWMNNIHDWCISRQIWWGHRIPAYYCDACDDVVVSRTAPAACPSCHGPVRQDEDVLDTWFSSALWPFSTLGWLKSSPDFETFYPTSVLSTGYDIIFFWVSRMIMQGVHFTGQAPFSTVLLHGLVRDEQGRKMSKSLGNGVNPMEIVEQYGADALRMALVLGTAPGNDYRWSLERFEAGRHFANKVYNAVRFVLLNLDDGGALTGPATDHVLDAWIYARLAETTAAITGYLEHFEFGQASRAIYDFLWDDYCDWYIELAKVRLKSGDPADRAAVLSNLVHVASTALALLHPFMPFVTEELWQALPHHGDSLMIAEWPDPARHPRGAKDAAGAFETMAGLVRAARNLRAEVNLAPAQRVTFVAVADDAGTLGVWRTLIREITELVKAERVELRMRGEGDGKPARAVAGVCPGGSVYLPLEGVVDIARERQRMEKGLAQAQKEAERIRSQLADPMFCQRAPAAVVDKARQTLAETEARISRWIERLEDLG